MRATSIFLVILLIIGSLSGCVPPPKVSSYPGAPPPARKPVPTPPVPVEKPGPAPAPAAPPPAPEVPPADKLTLPYIEQRLALYEEKFQQRRKLLEAQTGQPVDRLDRNTWDTCMAKADGLVLGYDRLRNRLSHEMPVSSITDIRAAFADLLKQDIAFLESDCGAPPPPAPTPAPPAQTSPDAELAAARSQAEAEIDRYFQAGQYPETIGAYQNLIASHPEAETSLTVARQYGLSLLYTGEMAMAMSFFNQLEPRLTSDGQPAQPWELQRLTADLQFASGNLNAARGLYNQLVAGSEPYDAEITWANMQLALLTAPGSEAGLVEYRSLLRGYLLLDQHGQGGLALLRKAEALNASYPASKVADAAMRIKGKVEKLLWARTDQRIAQARKLAGEKQNAQAAALLKELLAADLPEEMRDHVQRAFEEVLATEEQAQPAPGGQVENPLAAQMASARALLDSQRYDEAIVAYDSLKNTEYDSEARRGTTEAAGLAAKAKREEAAALFIKAMKTEDRERKKELLLSSRQLLREILVKYPGIDLTGKVNQNLRAVEEQLRAVDPQLLEEHAAAPAGND